LYIKIMTIILIFIPLGGNAYAQDDDSALTALLTPQFELPDSNYSSSGSIKLIWNLPDTLIDEDEYIFELQQSTDADFSQPLLRYTGPDLASYISGLKNNTYHYRVRSILGSDTSSWSKVVVVSVEHHSLHLAFILFGLGAFVFLATVVVVVRGARQEASVESTANSKQGDN